MTSDADKLTSSPRVIAAIVAWNRRDLLAQNLDGLAAQTRPLDGVVVIDNASTDDSADVARSHQVVTEVVTMPTNTGGAGGFAAGIARAIVTHQADLVWIMDDDTVPTPTALAELLDAREGFGSPVAIMASRADWTDGREHPMNTPRERFGISHEVRAQAASVGAKVIRSASFVSIMIDADAVRQEGLPQADFFLWNDDFEYTARILRRRTGLYVPASRVNHLTKKFGASDVDPGPRFYNEVRNKVWTFTRSSALGPRDSLLYGASTVRRWARTVAKSSNRKVLAQHGWRGLRDGCHRPRTTSEVLKDSPVAHDVAALEGGSFSHEPSELDDARFSVLLPVYAGDKPEFFARAIASVTVDQTLRPDELVVVQDGPVGPELADLIARTASGELSDGVAVKHVCLSENVGLALALEAGLAECTYEIVARADADDISLPERFEIQIPIVADGIDLLSSPITEFESDETVLGMVRAWPTDPAEIARLARFQDPFNHPSVVYRRSAVKQAGGYQHLNKMEDYWLFARMVHQGARIANTAEPLVLYRVGAGAYKRRGGLGMLRSELALQRHLFGIGFVTVPQLLRNVLVRGVWRIVPVQVRRIAYQIRHLP